MNVFRSLKLKEVQDKWYMEFAWGLRIFECIDFRKEKPIVAVSSDSFLSNF